MQKDGRSFSTFGYIAIAVFVLAVFVAILNYYDQSEVSLSPPHQVTASGGTLPEGSRITAVLSRASSEKENRFWVGEPFQDFTTSLKRPTFTTATMYISQVFGGLAKLKMGAVLLTPSGNLYYSLSDKNGNINIDLSNPYTNIYNQRHNYRFKAIYDRAGTKNDVEITSVQGTFFPGTDIPGNNFDSTYYIGNKEAYNGWDAYNRDRTMNSESTITNTPAIPFYGTMKISGIPYGRKTRSLTTPILTFPYQTESGTWTIYIRNDPDGFGYQAYKKEFTPGLPRPISCGDGICDYTRETCAQDCSPNDIKILEGQTIERQVSGTNKIKLIGTISTTSTLISIDGATPITVEKGTYTVSSLRITINEIFHSTRIGQVSYIIVSLESTTTYQDPCHNGIQDGQETGIDTGGACTA